MVEHSIGETEMMSCEDAYIKGGTFDDDQRPRSLPLTDISRSSATPRPHFTGRSGIVYADDSADFDSDDEWRREEQREHMSMNPTILRPSQPVRDESGVVGDTNGNILPFHHYRAGHIDKIINGFPDLPRCNEHICKIIKSFISEIDPAEAKGLVMELKNDPHTPQSWMRKATAVANFLINKIPLPWNDELPVRPLPDVQKVLDRDDINQRIRDHMATFRMISADAPVGGLAVQRLAIKMDIWYDGMVILEKIRAKAMTVGQGQEGTRRGSASANPSVNVVIGPVNIHQGGQNGQNGGDDEPEGERPPNDPNPDPTPPPPPPAQPGGQPDDHFVMIPSRGIHVAFSKNTHGRTPDEANRLTYGRDAEKIMHLRSNCSGMQNPQVHFIPSELAPYMRWCGACADYGKEVRMPNYCPCCDQVLGPGGHTDFVRYMQHTASHRINLRGFMRSCDEMYQRAVLDNVQEFLQACRQRLMGPNPGRMIMAGDWAGEMVRRSQYLANGL